ncbi:UNVERIFIED_CONTAM: hypothetical protein K2H54_066007 [Gekko kuhli]
MTVSTTVVPMYQPLNLQVTTCQKTGAAFDWLMQDTTTHEAWLLTPGPQRESWYKYEPVRETGTHPRHREEEMGCEDCLTHLEGLQDRLVQAVEEAVLEVPAMVAGHRSFGTGKSPMRKEARHPTEEGVH